MALISNEAGAMLLLTADNKFQKMNEIRLFVCITSLLLLTLTNGENEFLNPFNQIGNFSYF